MVERLLDSGDQERERGITILSKCASVEWRGTRINIVDTPGHADFGGEVERVLSMVDGVLLLVDAAEGPMPQTKFVLTKALERALRPAVVINKIDRWDARPNEVHEEIFDLFVALGASDAQLDFPIAYASAKEGWATRDPDSPRADMAPLFELILDFVAQTDGDADAPFAMLASILDYDPYLGRVLTGRIASGVAQVNMPLRVLNRGGDEVETARLTKLLSYRGVHRVPVEWAGAGDIIAVAGLKAATVAETLCAREVERSLKAQPVDPPTLAMTVSINDSPFAGRDGDKVTSRVLGTRLYREAEGNVAIAVSDVQGGDAFEVKGRGELQLGVLIETMRREGFELSVSRPRVVYRTDTSSGQRQEPIEEVVIDLDDEFVGVVVERLSTRKGEMTDMRPSGAGRTRLAAGKDDAVRLTTPRDLRLEDAIAYIADDELVEVTPRSIRLRKRWLDPHVRKRASRGAETG